MALFANASRGSSGGSSHLVEFKAGRAFLEPGSETDRRKVVSDKTKGTVFIKQTNDQLIHFCWKNRETNVIVDDLIIFPEDTKFLKVKECTDGRVFMLKFENNDRRLFWMQDNRADKDEELVKKVNDILNRPPSGRQGGRSGNTERSSGLGATLNALGNGNDDMGALNNLDQNQLMQLLQLMNSNGSASADALISSLAGGNDSTPTTTSSSTRRRQSAGNGGQVKLSDLQAIINSMDSNDEGSSAPGPSTSSRGPRVELADVLKASNLAETVKENEERLLPYLPNSEPVKADTEELKTTLTTPQFRQATDMFGGALQTGQMGMVLKQFGCSDKVGEAAATGDLMKFAKTLTDEQKGNTTEESADVEMTPADIDAEINREAEAEETTEAAVKEPTPKRNKTNDDMELD